MSWWAWWAALGAHAVLLLGLRVGVGRAPVWVSKPALIWETRPQRLRLAGGVSASEGLIRGAAPVEMPVLDALSTEMKRLVGWRGEIALEGSVVFFERMAGKMGEGEIIQRAKRYLKWRCEGEDEEGRRILGTLVHVEAPVDASNYRPRGPVILELVCGRGGEVRHAMIKVSSGDAAFDAAALRTVWEMRRKEVWAKDWGLESRRGDELRGQISVTVEPIE